MTDKQIIIDGVDISKCKHYDEVFNYCDQSYLGEGGLLKNTKNPKRCECSPNCYYKQLKRKEKECEELKQTLVKIKEIAEKEVKHAPDGETFSRPEIKQILQKISECEVKEQC